MFACVVYGNDFGARIWDIQNAIALRDLEFPGSLIKWALQGKYLSAIAFHGLLAQISQTEFQTLWDTCH